MLNPRVYTFDALLQKVPDLDGAYIDFPFDVRAEFGKGRGRYTPPLTAYPMTAAWYA